MPYLRLYSQEVPLEQKRVIAQKLIDLVLRTRLHAERNQITVQFMPALPATGLYGSHLDTSYGTECTLEVMAHNLTAAKKQAFTKEAVAALPPLLPAKVKSPLARLFGIKGGPPVIDLQFDELSPAISEPWSADLERKAA